MVRVRRSSVYVVEPGFMGAAKTLTKSDACFYSLILRRDLCTQVAIHRNGVAFLCFTGATVRGGAELGFTRPCVDAHSYRLGASPKLSGPLASAPTSRAPVQLRRAFEPGRQLSKTTCLTHRSGGHLRSLPLRGHPREGSQRTQRDEGL